MTDASVSSSPAPRRPRIFTEYVGLLGVLVVLVVLFGATTDHFLTPLTFTTLANQLPALTVIAVGLTLVLIAGGIDLSVGSVLALASAVLAIALVDWHLPLPLAIVVCLGLGLAAGLVNGLVTVPVTGNVDPPTATVRALQALTGGPTIEIGFAPVDALSGDFGLALSLAAPLRTAYAATLTAPITFSADTAAAGKYTLEANSAGVLMTAPVDVNVLPVPLVTFVFP